MITRYSPSRWEELRESLLASVGWGCKHDNLTWPISSWCGPEWGRKLVTRQVCLDCGKELEYAGPLRENV